MQSANYHLNNILNILRSLPNQDKDTQESIMQMEEWIVEFNAGTTDHFLKIYFIFTFITNVELSYRKELHDYASKMVHEMYSGLLDMVTYGHSFGG
jgi:hypothetical protein